MKKLIFVLLLFFSASVGREIFDYFSSLSEAFGAYKELATKMAHVDTHQQTLEPVEGYIVDVYYILESVQREGLDNVRLVAIQSVHYKKGFGIGNFGERRVLKTRHDVLMVRADGLWQISELQQSATEVTRLGDALSTE